jgi:hypothetical protein
MNPSRDLCNRAVRQRNWSIPHSWV